MLGFQLDLGSIMYRPGYLETLVGRAVRLGMDTILLEMGNKIPIQWLRRALHPDAWSRQELGRFLRLCRDCGITVIPLVGFMGHFNWILQWPWWSHLQENHHTVCPTHPETGELVGRLLEDTLELFAEAPIIHIGGDEAGVGLCPRCRESGKSKGQLYLEHHLPLIERIESAGKRAMIYDDLICGSAYPEALDALPKSVMICCWDYFSGAGAVRNVWGHRQSQSASDLADLPARLAPFREYLLAEDGSSLAEFPYARFCRDQGFDVVMLSAARCGGVGGENCVAPRTAFHVRNCLAASKAARQLGVEGVLVSSWACRSNHLELSWPSFAAGAWAYHEPRLSFDEASRRFAREWFGLDHPALFDVLDQLSPTLPDLVVGMKAINTPDVVRKWIEYWLYGDPDSEACREATQTLGQTRKSYEAGNRQLQRLADGVRRNRTMFQHWLLAARTLVHKARSLPTVMKLCQGRGAPRNARNRFVAEIDELVAEHRRLFGRTMPPASLSYETRLRFAETREILSR